MEKWVNCPKSLELTSRCFIVSAWRDTTTYIGLSNNAPPQPPLPRSTVLHMQN